MTRRERILERAARLLAHALNKETAEALYNIALAQAEEELGPPPYDLGRPLANVPLKTDTVPAEDL